MQCIAVSVGKCVILIWVLPHDGGRSADTSGRNEAMFYEYYGSANTAYACVYRSDVHKRHKKMTAPNPEKV